MPLKTSWPKSGNKKDQILSLSVTVWVHNFFRALSSLCAKEKELYVLLDVFQMCNYTNIECVIHRVIYSITKHISMKRYLKVREPFQCPLWYK